MTIHTVRDVTTTSSDTLRDTDVYFMDDNGACGGIKYRMLQSDDWRV